MSNSWKAPIGKHWGNGFVAEEKEREKKLPNQAVVPTPSTDATQNNIFAPYYESMRDDAEKQYKSDLAALDRNKNVQMQEAAINNELLKKYLPTLNQMSGLSGLGVSESANIDALSRYQNTVSGIEQGYTQSKSELDRYLRSDLADINAAERAEQREDQSEAYQMASMQIMGATSAKEIDDILAAWGDRMSEPQYDILASTAEGYKAKFAAKETTEKEKMGETTAAGDINKEGDSVTIKVGSRSVPLAVVGETDVQGAIDASGYYNDGEVFLYDKKIYYKQNDAVYELMDTSGNSNSENYSVAYNFLKNGTVPEGYGKDLPANTKQSERIDRFDAPEGTKVVDSPQKATNSQGSKTSEAPEDVQNSFNSKVNRVEITDPDEGTISVYNESGRKLEGRLETPKASDIVYEEVTEAFKDTEDGNMVYMKNKYGTYGWYVRLNNSIYKVNF